jgi:hypothetical protein
VAGAPGQLGVRVGLGRRLDGPVRVALALGGLGGQRPKQARKLASRLAERDAPVSDELRALLDDPVSRAENYASLLVVLVILVLMVFKP